MCSKDLCGVPVVCFSPFIICILKECHENFYLVMVFPFTFPFKSTFCHV